MPSSRTSNEGTGPWSSGRVASASQVAYRAAAASGSSPSGPSLPGMARTRAGSMSRWHSSASRAPVSLTGTAQLRHPAVGPGNRDRPVGGGEADLGDAGAGRDLARDRDLQPGRQPDADQVGARVALLGTDRATVDRAVRLVEDGGE